MYAIAYYKLYYESLYTNAVTDFEFTLHGYSFLVLLGLEFFIVAIRLSVSIFLQISSYIYKF